MYVAPTPMQLIYNQTRLAVTITQFSYIVRLEPQFYHLS